MSEKRQAASWIADEYGGSYLNNPEQQNRDLAAANDMAILIQRTVRDRNGGEAGYRRAGELINETLDELRGRAPFGFVTPAFALGTTQVLLEKANTMDGPQFLQYLEGIRDRDNPLFFWQRSTLDPLSDEVKERTRAHVEEIYGRSTFTVFDALKGQRGPVAFSAGAADAVLDEVGTGGRGLILGASNPVEAGRQAVDMLRNLDRVPQALQQQVSEAQKLIQAAGLDDYHKGFLTVRVAFIALDAADVVEAGLSVGNLARRLRNGEVNNIGDALRALDEGPQVMRQRGQAGDANDLSAGDVSARTRTPTASPSAQAATLTDQLVDGLPANYREPYREAFTQLLRANNYDTPEEVAAFSRWLNDNPDHAVTRRYHEIAQQTMQQQVVSAYPDRVEFAYQRALDDSFRDAGANTPQDRMAYMQGFTGANAAAFRTALDERALTHVVDNSLRQIPDNVRDAYRGSVASILSEQGYLGQGRFDPNGAQQYIDNLAGAPGGPSAMAVHNRAMNIVVNGASDRFPDGTEAYYARAYRQTFEAENIRDPSAAQRYIDNLDGAPNGQAMRAVHNRASAAIVRDVVDDLPQNVQPAYARALRLSLDAAGKDSPAEVLDYARNLTDGRQVQSMAALHQRAFDSVVQSAVSSIDEPSRPAYTQALRESLDAGGRGPARSADGSPAWDYGSVERAQQYVIDLATSPQAMARIHERADAILGGDRTPDRTAPPQTSPQDRVDPPDNTSPPARNPPAQNPPPTDRQNPDQAPLPPASQPANPGQRLLNPAPDDAPDVGVRLRNETTGSISISAPAGSSIGVDVQNSTTGAIQTVSGSGNVQVSGNRETLGTAATAVPDSNGNVQVTDAPGLRIELKNPGTSGRTGTDVRIDNSTVNGGVQSIVGNDNVQIDINQARINGDRRQTVIDGDNNRQTQNLGGNVTADSVTQTIDGRSDSRQQVGNDVPSPVPHTAVEGSVSRVVGNGNAAVTTEGGRNVVEMGRGGDGVTVDGVRIAPADQPAPHPAPAADGRVSGGIQNGSTVSGSVSLTEGHDNATVMATGGDHTVRIGRDESGDQARKVVFVDDSETVRSSHLNGQSVAYTPRFSTHHDLTGDGAGTYTTISGHGVLETDRVIPPIGNSVQRDTFVVPEGVNLHFLGLPGGVITDRLGQRADVGGDLSGVPLLKLGTGDTAPDILITPAFGTINIQGNPITVDNPQGVRLSQLIRDHDLSGNIVVSACLQQSVSQGNREHWQGITFDLPDRYPKPDPPDLSGLPPRLPIDPNFHTQHGLTNAGDGKYTAIGGNAGLSGTNPNTGKSFAEQTFTVPEGVTVHFPSLPGGSVHNRLAEAIEKGEDLSRIPLLKAGAGSTAPDPMLLPGNYEVAGNFVRVTDREGQRLSEVIKEQGLTGNVVVAGGLQGRDRPHSNVLFDVPEHYPDRDARGGTRGFDLSVEQAIGSQSRAVESPASQPPASQPRDQTSPANDGRQSSLPDTAAPASGRGDPGLDDPRHPNHTMFASALDRIQTFERGRGIDSGDFARNLAGSLTVSAVESRLPQINHVVFNAEGTRAFAVDTPSLDAEWRRVAYTDVAGAGQQTLAASSERLRELQPPALSPAAVQQDMQQRPDEQARNAARMV